MAAAVRAGSRPLNPRSPLAVRRGGGHFPPACHVGTVDFRSRGAATGSGPPRSACSHSPRAPPINGRWSGGQVSYHGDEHGHDAVDTRPGPAGASGPAGRGARRSLGHDAAGRRADPGGLPRRAVPGPPARRDRRPGPAEPDPARRHPRRAPAVPGGGRGHHHDEHVHRDEHRPGRLRAAAAGAGDEPAGRRAGAPGRGRGGRPFRRRFDRPAERHAVAVPAGGGSRVPGGVVRRGPRRVRRADPGAGRRRRRPAADRDDLRHAQREGRDRRRPRGRPAPAAVDLGDDRRPERAHAVRADRRGVLELHRARRAAGRRRELLAGRRGDAPARRRAVAARRHVHGLPPQRRPAERVRRLRPDAGGDRAAARRVRRVRPGQHRRRLLRDVAGAHRADRGRREGPRAPYRSRRGRRAPGSAAWSPSRSARTPGS